MTKTETICDQCGTHKGNSGNWTYLVEGPNYFQLFKELPPGYEKVKDVCSMMCATKALQQFLQLPPLPPPQHFIGTT